MRLVVAALVVAALTACSTSAPPPALATPSTDAAQSSPFDMHRVDQALRGDEPYSIRVFSDSTADRPNEWVGILSARIAAAYGREVTLHSWSTESSTYSERTVYGGDPERRVTIWNGSGSGKPVQYSIKNFETMMPTSTNVAIISHGHNDPTEALSGIKQLVGLSFGKGAQGVVVVIQNPRISSPVRAKLEADTFNSIAAAFNPPPPRMAVVDVFSAFNDHPGVAGLLRPDGLHPNDAGSQFWADTVATEFGLAEPD